MSRKQSNVIHFYIDPEAIDENTATFSREESDHILKTFRLYIGDSILATDGLGNLHQMKLSAFEDRRVKATISKSSYMVGELPVRIGLGFGLPQLSKTDQIIDQCTQLGISEFYPLLSKNSKTKLTGEKSKARTGRWRKVAISAVKQSLRSVIPEIHEPLNIDSLVTSMLDYSAVYIGSLRGKESTEIELDKADPSILLLTGPEEGFSRIEEDKLIRAGAMPISLGSRRLRAELAPVVLTALISNRNS